MFNRYGKLILSLCLTFAVLLGFYLGAARFIIENARRQVELAIDLNDLKQMAAFEKKPLGQVLAEVNQLGIKGIGVFEETLPDASALGEVYSASGSGIIRLKLPQFAEYIQKKAIKPDLTYIYAPNETVRRRIYEQVGWALGNKAVSFLGPNIMQIDEQETELRSLGLGISEIQKKYLEAKGFEIIPRIWNDPRYHLGNIGQKISGLNGYRIIIFDKNEVLGYPDALAPLAGALVKNNIKYGYLEIIKQEGENRLKKLMGAEVVRVQSVPRDELKKVTKDEALDRFVRAVRERGVQLIYLRPFLPPQVDAYPVEYNLDYFKALRDKLAAAGFTLGLVGGEAPRLSVKPWQVTLLGLGVLIGSLFLLEAFWAVPTWIMWLVLAAGGVTIFAASSAGQAIMVQKLLAFLAALTFPSYAVISTFSTSKKPAVPSFQTAAAFAINIMAETSIGVFLMVGLMADWRFMAGIEVFPGVKTVLALPVIIVAAYFLLKSETGSLVERFQKFAKMQVSLLAVLVGLIVLAAIGLLIARSGNFIIPVPAVERNLRDWLEMVLFVRPRTKEFLIGYPALFLAAWYYLRGEKTWLWLLAAVGVIAPVSVFNTFSHIHTPLLISAIRTFNGLVLGCVAGLLVWWVAGRFIKKEA